MNRGTNSGCKERRRGLAFQSVKATYTSAEITRLFGFDAIEIDRWAVAGLIVPVPGSRALPRYDFRALTRFRRVRELRGQGVDDRRIEADLRGSGSLLDAPTADAGRPPARLGPFEQGLACFERGDVAGAETSFQRATKTGDFAADAWTNLGVISACRGDVGEAFDRFTWALGLEPRHLEAQFDLACLYFEAEDLRLARLHFELCLIVEPGFADAYFNLGLACTILGDLRAGLTALERYRALDPGLPSDKDPSTVEHLIETVKRALGAEASA